MEFRIPLSTLLRFRSQSIEGKINDMVAVLNIPAKEPQKLTNMRNQLYFPKPKKKKKRNEKEEKKL